MYTRMTSEAIVVNVFSVDGSYDNVDNICIERLFSQKIVSFCGDIIVIVILEENRKGINYMYT